MRLPWLVVATMMILSPCSAAAGWEVHTYLDRMTDKKSAEITLKSNTDAGAWVRVYCFPSMAGIPAHMETEIEFGRVVGFYETGVEYRFDNESMHRHFARISTNRRSVWLWSARTEWALAKLKQSKRLRVTVGQAFLDFDLAGATNAIKQVKCP